MTARNDLRDCFLSDSRDRFEAAADAYRAEVLAEAADKLALELTPEGQGAGPGFLLALRLAMRALRRMADDAATAYASTRGEPGDGA